VCPKQKETEKQQKKKELSPEIFMSFCISGLILPALF